MCKKCVASDHDVHLHVEIENLKQKLVERENHIVTMETNFLNEANKFPSGELVALREELLTWQDKYKRLYDAHRRVQRVNQGLEDKLLKLVDVCETEKTTLTKDVAVLSQKLAEANYAVKKLTEDNERYKNDVSLAIQFLQCKQSNFVAHKFDSLPQEVQVQVSSHMTNKRKPEEKKGFL
jgi:tight junction protein 4 (peripheral)